MLRPIRAGAASLSVLVLASGGMHVAAEEAAELEESKPVLSRTVPSSSTAYTFSELESRGVHGLTDMVAGNSAALLIQPSVFDSSSFSLSLRGMSATTPHQATGESAVGVFLDGTYIGRTQGLSLDLLDIESVEVVRGSQAILGGRNTTGGAVYLSSSKPTGEFGFEQKLQFGEVGDEVTSISHLNLPRFADVLSLKLSYLMHNYDGWVDNDRDDVGSGSNENFWVRDNEGLRVALRLDQGGPFVYDYSFLDAEVNSTRPYFQVLQTNGALPTDVAVETGFQDEARAAINNPESKVDVTHHNQTVTLHGERATATAIVSFREVDSRQLYDFEDLLGPLVVPSTGSGNQLEQEQFAQKIQLDTHFYDGLIDFTVGVQNFNEEVDLRESGNLGSTEVDSFAIYAQSILNVTDALELSFGWRETSEEKRFESERSAGVTTGVEFEFDDDNTDYKIGVSFDIVEESLRTFLSYATGHKSGGASLLNVTLPAGFSPYLTEETETIELGLEGAFWNDLLSFSVVAFTTDIDNRQVEILNPANLRQSTVVNNSGTDTIEGLELDLRLAIADTLIISGFYSYLDADEDVMVGGVAVPVNFARAPEHSSSLAVDLNLGDTEVGQVKLHVEYTGIGDYWFNSTQDVVGSRDVFNARLSVSGFELEDSAGDIEIGIWANNLTDDEYLVTGAEVENTTLTSDYAIGAFGEPRTFGLDIRYVY